MGFSAFFFGFGSLEIGTLTLAIGAATTLLSYERRKKARSLCYVLRVVPRSIVSVLTHR